ncbi:MAG: FAD-dependent oxidoreductase [Planctomycetes bacterium]|nr:FAD-dependent oxidoreductase [Planctomycetota bacterium]
MADSMITDPLLQPPSNRAALLLGNEAIVRGAIEAGVGFACGYPGTPSSEITDTFARLAPIMGIPFEYSVNEKIALEVAFAASLSGARSIVAMKHLGLTSAGDPLTTMPYIGTVGGMVIVSAGDPSCLTSPNEQDQRHLADMLFIPTLDPSSPQEALEMTRFAFELSEKSNLPVLLRPTTRVCHTRAAVKFGEIRPTPEPKFVRNPKRFLPIPAHARQLREDIKDRLKVAEAMVAEADFHSRIGDGKTGVISCGAASAICRDVVDTSEHSLLHTGCVFPLPESWLLEQLSQLERLLIVEELSPFLEDAIRTLASVKNLGLKILGKRTGHVPLTGELNAAQVSAAIECLAEDYCEVKHQPASISEVAPRPPILCAGCPHRSAFFAVKSALGPDVLCFNDIGCYTLGAAPPLATGDALLCMGAGISMAAGAARTLGKPTVGFIGDSTFFHSGMPALLNAVKENVDMTVVIMDNEVTAMTGLQESPTIAVEQGRVKRRVSIEGVVKSLGCDQVEIVNPNDLDKTISAFKTAHAQHGVSVVITEYPCVIFANKAGLDVAQTDVRTYEIDHSLCQHCGREESGHRCSQSTQVGFERAMAKARSLESYSDSGCGSCSGSSRSIESNRPDVAPCASGCPLHLCIQGYAAHIAAGDYSSALELIMERLPLPDSVCRVCDRPCEDVCVRGKLDAPVAINDLKRFVMDWANEQPEFPDPRKPEPDNGQNVAIIGAGPAGLSAAQDLKMRGFGVTLFDAAPEAGGLLRYGIPEYRLPREVLQRDIERIFALGVEFKGGQKLGQNIQLSTLKKDFDAVLIAAGASKARKLEIPGDGERFDALDFLSSEQKVSGDVVVVGGGNASIDAARTVLRRGASSVTIACLEAREAMPAIRDEITEAEHEGVKIVTGVRGLEVSGRELSCINVEGKEFSDVAGTEHTMIADCIIFAIGQQGDSSIDDLGLDWNGQQISADAKTGGTSDESVFAAGDIAPGQQTVTATIAAGLRSAWAIDAKLRGQEVANKRTPPPLHISNPPSREGVSRADNVARAKPVELELSQRVGSFAEVIGTLTEAQAQAEAERCMICGTCGNCRACLDLFGCPAFAMKDGKIIIEEELCTACGVCAQFCPNGAILPVMKDSV